MVDKIKGFGKFIKNKVTGDEEKSKTPVVQPSKTTEVVEFKISNPIDEP